jgi:hypothetical protein
VWIFNVWGTIDLLNAFYVANATGLSAGQLCAAFFIPMAIVPLLLITHGLIFRILLRHDGGCLVGETSTGAAVVAKRGHGETIPDFASLDPGYGLNPAMPLARRPRARQYRAEMCRSDDRRSRMVAERCRGVPGTLDDGT